MKTEHEKITEEILELQLNANREKSAQKFARFLKPKKPKIKTYTLEKLFQALNIK